MERKDERKIAQILAKTENKRKQIKMNDAVYREANEIIIYWREYTFYYFNCYKTRWSALCTFLHSLSILFIARIVLLRPYSY